MRATHGWIIGLVACATLGGAACNRTAEQEGAQTQTPATQSAAPRGDTAITTAVQAKYYTDDAVRARHIDVSTEDGVVTLTGTVESEAARQQAVNLAKTVAGVSRVEDQLQVAAEPGMTASAERPAEPAGEPATQDEATGTAGRDAEGRVQPAWITTKIQAQYFVSPEIKPWNIDVTTTSGGVVTLQGEVETAEDKAEALRIARATEGVTQVEDRLRLKGEPAERTEPAPAAAETKAPAGEGVTPPDAWLTAKIQSKYFLDSEVKGHEIDVDTHDGVVTLKGTVASEAHRRQAVALASNTDGVKSVNDQLEVQPEAAEPDETPAARPGATPGTAIPPVLPVVDDTWITTKIQSKYFLDADVKGHEINVDTRRGVVTLKGNVETEAQKKEAEQIARETQGVTKVVNNLVVGGR